MPWLFHIDADGKTNYLEEDPEREFWPLKERIYAAIERVQPGASKDFGAQSGANIRAWFNELFCTNIANDTGIAVMRKMADEAERVADQMASTAEKP